jgi:transcriptional regulator GlxA family with amidase domain
MMSSAERDPGNRASWDEAVLAPLVRSLLPPDEANDVLRGVYTIAFQSKLMERLERIRNSTAANVTSQQGATLQAWRLKRVTSFVDQNLDSTLSLDCLARVAGLSRMHFAALFRKTTGLRPHDFVVRRRIDIAQQLLAKSQTPIVEIALAVGFQSQAHFTTVFKRVLGVTPHLWRQMSRGEGATP